MRKKDVTWRVAFYVFVLLIFMLVAGALVAHAVVPNLQGWVYFEIDKIPISSVDIVADGNLDIRCGESVLLRSVLCPKNAETTVISTQYVIVDGNDYATLQGDRLEVHDTAPVGSHIEVMAVVDGVHSHNSIVFTVARTPVSSITILNEEDGIVVGGALKMNAEVFPADATNNSVRYSIVSGPDCLKISYYGVLSFTGSEVDDGKDSVTVRATSISDPNVYDEKTFRIYHSAVDVVNATVSLNTVHQQGRYSFSTSQPYLKNIFQNEAVSYAIETGSDIASVDINGLLFIDPHAPIGAQIVISMTADSGKKYTQSLTVVSVYATGFTPVLVTPPSEIYEGIGFYFPGSILEFDVVAFTPCNVTNTNKVFSLSVDDPTLAYIDGNKVVIRDANYITESNPTITVTVHSEPNGLSEEFTIPLHMPVKSVIVTGNMTNVEEGNAYNLDDLLDYVIQPMNATVRSVRYELHPAYKHMAEIKDGHLIVSNDLAAGDDSIQLAISVNGVRSNVLKIEVYRPTRSLDVEIMVDGTPLSETNLPGSSSTTADTVTVLARVDSTASLNASQIIVTRGAENIEGKIELINVYEGIACFEFTLKKNLASTHPSQRVISLYAIQDGIQTKEIDIAIYIPNERICLRDMEVKRGDTARLYIENSDINACEIQIEQDGVEIRDGGFIWIPHGMKAGDSFIIRYRSKENPKWEIPWKQATVTIARIEDVDLSIFKGIYSSGFNVVFGTDSQNIMIDPYDPELWVGRSLSLNLTYGTSGYSIVEYGMEIVEVSVSQSEYGSASLVDGDTIQVAMKDNADGQTSIGISLVVRDGNEYYHLDGFYIDAFKPLTANETLSFKTVDETGRSVFDWLDSNSRDLLNRLDGGLGAITFTNLDIDGGGISINNNVLNVNTFAAAKEQKITCKYAEFYNNKVRVEVKIENIPLLFKTVKIDKNGGSGGYDEIVAVKGMAANNVQGDLTTVASQKTDYICAGFEGYIDANGKVYKDYDNVSSIKTSWKLNVYYYTVLSDVDGSGAYKIQFGQELVLELSSFKWLYDDYVYEFSSWEWTEKGNVKTSTEEKIILKDLVDTPGDHVYIYLHIKRKPQCVASGTLITLSDGTQRPVEELNGTEHLLVWDFHTGSFDSAPILFIDTHGVKEYTVTHLYFDDGTVVDIIDEHGFWNVGLNEYVYITSQNAQEWVGKLFVQHYTDENGDMRNKTARLVRAVNEQMVTNSYSPVTAGALCYYVDGMLSVPSETQGLVNYFDIDAATMRYDQERMEEDIEKYGLLTSEEFNVPAYIFNAFNGQYIAVSLGKGLITEEMISYLIETYSKYFIEGG